MRPRCIASDLDRTLTGPELRLDPAALARIDALRAAGIRVVIATGRRLDELEAMGLDARADALVAENGALVRVAGATETSDARFADRARAALADLAGSFVWGSVLGSGPRHLAQEARARLARAGIPHGVEFNAEEVMLLPEGVDKASGLRRCLERLGIAPEACWAIGDGENDASMLRLVARGAAPANAVPTAREAARVQLASAYSLAFLELTEPLVAEAPAPRASRGEPVGGRAAGRGLRG